MLVATLTPSSPRPVGDEEPDQIVVRRTLLLITETFGPEVVEAFTAYEELLGSTIGEGRLLEVGSELVAGAVEAIETPEATEDLEDGSSILTAVTEDLIDAIAPNADEVKGRGSWLADTGRSAAEKFADSFGTELGKRVAQGVGGVGAVGIAWYANSAFHILQHLLNLIH